MLPGQAYTPEHIIGIARRRWWLVLLPVAVGGAVGLSAYRDLPLRYRSEAALVVASPGSVRIEDWLPALNDRVQSRSRLERIIADFSLYEESRALGPMADVVDAMRRDIDVTARGAELFRVSYTSAQPSTAQQVTDRLASLYIEESRRESSGSTPSGRTSDELSLDSQLDDAKQQLMARERELAEYRERYSEQLPAQVASSLETLQSALRELQALRRSLDRSRERRLLIQRHLADAERAAVPVDVVTSSPAGRPELTVQQLDASPVRGDPGTAPGSRSAPGSRDAVAAESRTVVPNEGQQAPTAPGRSAVQASSAKSIGELRSELDALDRQLAARTADEARLNKKIADSQATIALFSARASELAQLSRDYAALQEAYTELLTQRSDLAHARTSESDQFGGELTLLHPASLPHKPYNERERRNLVPTGALAGLLLGLLGVAFLEGRDSTFKTEDDVSRVLAVPVLALVPLMTSASEGTDVQSRRRRVARAVGVVIILTGFIVLAVWRLQP